MQQTLQSAKLGLIRPHGRVISMDTLGIYAFPRMLTDVQVQEIIGLKELKCHHDEHGHNGIGHGGSPEEPEDKEEKPKPEKDKGVDKMDQSAKPRFFRADKPHRLPWVAALIYRNIPRMRVGALYSHSVDENMQLYKLQEGAGAVPPHVDEDFNGPKNTRALCSILVYLNDGYRGGETVFSGTTPAPHVVVGGGLVFRHDILHEGLVVLSGEKYVLKTDLLFRSC